MVDKVELIVVVLAGLAIVGTALGLAGVGGGPDAAPTGEGVDDDGGGGTTPERRNASGSTSATVEIVDATSDVEVDTHTWPAFAADGTRLGNATWRVVEGTGNCCENYLTTTPEGRIVDLGGTYPFFSLDHGRTWYRVQPVSPFVNGEGAVTVAPDGDILAVMWDPYSGDRLVAFKYDAQEQMWDYAETPLRTPFFDRPWLTVIPGPVEFGGETHPYAAYLRGGFPSKEVGFVSVDGLHYLRADSPSLLSRVGGTSTLEEVAADPMADWTQPHTESDLTPLPGGGALAHVGTGPGDCPWKQLHPDFSWSCVTVDGLEEGRVLVDGDGRLHNVQVDGGEVTYRVAETPGSWTEATWQLPDRYQVEDWDLKVSANQSKAALALHTHDSDADADQDILLVWNVSDAPRPERYYLVGAGDLQAQSGFGNDVRFDFATLGILPDGRVAMSFADADHHPPSVAVLVGMP